MTIQTKTGLKPEHHTAPLLYQKTYIPPAYGDKMISRLYDDGSLYFFSEENGLVYISQLTNEGLIEMNRILNSCSRLNTMPQNNATSMGAVIWELFSSPFTKKIIVYGIPIGEYQLFNQIDQILNSKMKPIPKG